MSVLAKYGFEEALAAIRGHFPISLARKFTTTDITHSAETHSRAVRARLALEELGPTFIKLGQLLSTRPDLIPHDYIKELESLQDQVPPENPDVIQAEIEQQLGGSLEKLFKSFEREPIAAGSIAQVHRAVTYDGKLAAVKVRRPGIEQTIYTECEILQDLAGLLKASLFKDGTIDPQKMVKEFSDAVTEEVNLDNERHNQLRFLQSFSGDATIHVPAVYKEYCSKAVLTMEYIDGIKTGNKEELGKRGLAPRIIAQRGARFVLRQIFEFGFFHADPHPGNFLILPDNVLAPLDFGQIARLSMQDRKLLNEIVLAIVENEPVGMIEALEETEIIGEETKTEQLLRDAGQMLDFYHGRPLKEIPFGKVIAEIFDLIRMHGIKPPPQFTLMLKSLATIESFATSLDPDFQIIEQLKPYARQYSLRDIDPKQILKNAKRAVRGAGDLASRLPDDVNSILRKFRQGKFQLRVHHEHLDNLNKTLDKSSNRISFALIIASLLIGSSLLVPQEGTVLGLFSLQALGILGYIVAAIIGLWLIISIIGGRHL
jgi:ubiquinone biosynthesis protein